MKYTLCLCVVFVTAMCFAETWNPPAGWQNGWRGPSRCGVYEARDLPSVIDDANGIVWHQALRELTIAEPIAVGDRVITLADPDWIVCLDIESGRILWEKRVSVIELVGKEKGYDARRIARDEKIRELCLAMNFRKRAGDFYGWKEGYNQGKDILDAAMRIGEIDPALAIAKPYDLETVYPTKDGKRVLDPNARDAFDKWLNQNVYRHLKEYEVDFYPAWMSWIGHTAATPVCDAKHVYTAMSHGQVACHDLDGTRKWVSLIRFKNMDYHQVRFLPSPLLVGDRMIVQFGNVVAAFDKTNGKVLWKVDHDVPGRTYNGGSPLHLSVGGKDLIVFVDGKIRSAATGEEVGSLGAEMCGSEGGCATPVASGNRVVFFTGRNDGGPIKCFELAVGANDKVAVKEAWAIEKARALSNISPILKDNLIYKFNGRSHDLLDLQTGRQVGTIENLVGEHASLACADGRIYNIRPGGTINEKAWDIYIRIAMLDHRGKSDDLRAMPVMRGNVNTAISHYLNPYFPTTAGGVRSISSTGPHPVGNRILYRYKGGMFAFGDVFKPYTYRKAELPALPAGKLNAWLASDVIAERIAAVRALKTAPETAAVPLLTGLLTNADYGKRITAVHGFQALGAKVGDLTTTFAPLIESLRANPSNTNMRLVTTALGAGGKSVVPLVTNLLAKSPEIAYQVINYMPDGEEKVRIFLPLLTDTSNWLFRPNGQGKTSRAVWARESLAAMGPSATVIAPEVRALLGRSNEGDKVGFAALLIQIDLAGSWETAFPPILKMAQKDDKNDSPYAIAMLVKLAPLAGKDKVLNAIKPLADSKEWQIAAAAKQALEDLTAN